MSVQGSDPVSLHHRELLPQALGEDLHPQDMPSPRGKGNALLLERETPQRNTTPGNTGGVGLSRKKHLSPSNTDSQYEHVVLLCLFPPLTGVT